MAALPDSASTSPSGGGDTSGSFEVFNGEIAELAPHADILKSLECPVCREIALAPIYTCENGHITCFICRQRLRTCALCKVRFSDIRNYGLESILAKSKIYCKYKEFGCTEIVLGETLNDHVRSCSFKCPEEPPASVATAGVRNSSADALFDRVVELFNNSSFGGSIWDLSDDDEESGSYVQIMGWRRGRNGSIPPNAVRAGFTDDGTGTFVCRAFHQRMCLPGTICTNDRLAYVNFFGTAKSKHFYEVLVAIPGTVSWVHSRRGAVPDNAVVGAEQDGFERIYIGRTKIDDQWVAGYIKHTHRRCYVTNGNTTIGRKYYQFLVTLEPIAF